MSTLATAETRHNAKVAAVTGCILGAAAAFVPHGLVFRENRIAAGHASSLAASGAWGVALAVIWTTAALIALSRLPERVRGYVVTLLSGTAVIVCIAGSGEAASGFASKTGDIARTSLGAGFWLTLGAGYIVIFAATAWLEAGWRRALVTYLPVIGTFSLLAYGRLDALAIMREYSNNADEFARQLGLHLTYVAGAVGVGLVAGIAFGLLATRGPRSEAAVFGVLNVLQVWPTLALVGIMYPLLTAAARHVPALEAAGVRGVGWAPVMIVLATYAVYPIARNVHSAMVSLDRSVIDAARGVGMGRARRLVDVELPLAFPVILAGLRIALVQTTAGAIVAGLVGGGGLGVFVFLGAGQTATDLILLGVVPIVALALFFDRTALALQHALDPGKGLS